jgi:hypothetical protein
MIGGVLLSASNTMAGDDMGAKSMSLLGGSQGQVTFPHGLHQSILVDCMPCHGLFPKEARGLDKMKGEGKLEKKAVMNMCKKCHKDLDLKGQKTGPTTCKGCHKK